MKKWWFSIFCWIVAVSITIFSVVMLFVDEEQFYMSTQMFSVLSPALLLIIIGSINKPRKEKDND